MNYKFETNAIHAGYQPEETTGSIAVPIYRTSSYRFKDTKHAADLFGLKELGNIYTRIGNPTQEILEKRIASLDGGVAALALASGTSAIFYIVINICKTGDEIVSANNLYGGTGTMFKDILPQFGIKANLVDAKNPQNIQDAINPNTKAIYIEAIGNPGLDVVDIEEISKIAKENSLPLVIDSTFATPYLCQPIKFGADIVVHSLTKWIGGHGTGIGGIVVDAGTFDWRNPKFELYNQPDPSYHGLRYAHDLGEMNKIAFIMRMRLVALRNLGACISPDNAWMFLQGLETLSLRMERHSENALQVANYLKNHQNVDWVRYPGLPSDPNYETAQKYFNNGFGGMVIFGHKKGKKAGEKFINKLQLFSHLANVGDAKSLAIHPASTTHSQMTEQEQIESGIMPELVRLSIGIENIDDIIADLDQALAS
ncbi:O-acetylhomoserine aminocarboxypropyltransferase/cysteine synthase family protein [Candidatus Margulisiibacteriota bacterium]